MMDRNLVQACVQIIDLGSTRGAWKGDDLLPVGQVRAQLLILLEEITKAEKSATIGDVKDMAIGDAVPE